MLLRLSNIPNVQVFFQLILLDHAKKTAKNVKHRCTGVFCHAKSGTTNNHRTGLSDISYQNQYSCDLNHIKKLQKNLPKDDKKPV